MFNDIIIGPICAANDSNQIKEICDEEIDNSWFPLGELHKGQMFSEIEEEYNRNPIDNKPLKHLIVFVGYKVIYKA